MKLFLIIFTITIGLDRVAPESKENSALFPVLNSRNQNERNIVMKKIPIEELLNKRFGRLIITKQSRVNNAQRWVLCKCDCGKEKEIRLDHLLRGESKSCGCTKVEIVTKRNYKHGLYNHSLHSIWNGMITRCGNPKRENYKNYGGRGITVCEEWLTDFQAFYNWSMASGYEKGLQIDRKNNDGNYEPSNCQWLTLKENIRKKSGGKMDVETAQKIRDAYSSGYFTQKELAKIYNTSKYVVYDIVHCRGWN